ncbi:MAG: CehA/McbA family metallohydrolase [Lacunisphaera sp.]|nr:CehA/McbA family metallohydrolase [Lacunisphaera sp.]
MIAFPLTLLLAGLPTMGAAEIVQFTVRTVDEYTKPISARVLVRDDLGRSWLPPVATTVNIGPDTWFACDGAARLDVPPGRYHVTVERGPEYVPATGSLTLAGNTSREFQLHQWIDLRALGYRSGENHLHLPRGALESMMRAEDLGFGSSLQWWNGARLPVPDLAPRAKNLTLFDAEVENAWGAVYCVGLSKPMALPWNPARANLAFVEAARADGALICYQGGWSREALVDALLGRVDVVNVGDNLFHRHKFMPRARYANLLAVPGLSDYPDTADGMLALTTEAYYRLLNCGLRLAAGTGSATGVKSSPAGYNRSYVRVDGNATVREFLEAWRQGRNFVTNGPMLFLTADGRHEPGDTIKFPKSGGAVQVRVQVQFDQPLRSLAIVVNGKTIATTAQGELEVRVPVTEGSWIAAVATAEDHTISDAELARYAQQSPLGGETPTRLRFAHTSPIYVTVGGGGARVEAAIDEARRMLDAFEVFARKTAAPEFQPEILQAVADARKRLGWVEQPQSGFSR